MDYPDWLIDYNPQSPYYNDSLDELTAESELPDLDEVPRNRRTEHIYRAYDIIMQLRKEKDRDF